MGANTRLIMRVGSRNCTAFDIVHAIFKMILVGALTSCAASFAQANDLYRAQTVVTGEGEVNRLAGFAVCLEDVLIKVSGSIDLAGDPRLRPYKAVAQDFVQSYNYRDQKLGKPKADEQGTRDRPYDLTVNFDKSGIDAILRKLGMRPWLAPRPLIGAFIRLEHGDRKYVISVDPARSDLSRVALLAAAEKRGLSVVLPDAAMLEMLGNNEFAGLFRPQLAAAMLSRGGEVLLLGRLIWVDQELHWNVEWQLHWRGQSHHWHSSAVTFDEAYRRGLGETAQLLSVGR